MKEVEIEGKSVEEAISKALEQLQATPDEVEIKIINEGKAGLFGLMGAVPARVKVIFKAPAPIKNMSLWRYGAQAKAITDNLLEKMMLDGESEVIIREGKIVAITIESLDSALLIGKQGQTLDAFQHIVNLILTRQIKTGKMEGIPVEERNKIIIDTEGYRERRDNALIRDARQVAERVRETGKKERLSPMSSHERRIIHLALKDVEGVYTESEGERETRFVVILPRKK